MKCKICGKELDPRRTRGYCQKHWRYGLTDEQKAVAIEKQKATCVKKYGATMACNGGSAKEKTKETLFKKYGVDNAFNIPEVRQKAMQNCNSKEANEKRKQTNFEHSGVEFNFQSKDTKEKAKKTCLERLGVEHAAQSEICKAKSRETCMEKYGVPYVMQTKEWKNTAKQTMIEKYGVDNPLKSTEIKQNIKTTYLSKYGTEHSSQNEDVKTKQRTTIANKTPEERAEIARKYTLSRSHCIAEDGTKLDSNWEVIIWNFCKRNNISIEHGPVIKYEYNGKIHSTHIDFMIDGRLFEIKGNHLLLGCYDYQGIPIAVKLNIYEKNNVILITFGDTIDTQITRLDIKLFNLTTNETERWKAIKNHLDSHAYVNEDVL
jgi:hypothetical protein